jgi:anti-sigma factor RsiW
VIELGGACARHRSALLDFVDRGEIAPGTAGALAHLERCNRCTDELESTVLAITALRRLGDDLAAAEPSPDAWPRLRARLDRWRPARWAIMSPTAGVVMSVALVAVLVAPLRIGTSVPSASPAELSAAELGVSLEERRAEAAYLANIRLGTLPQEEPAGRPVVTYPRNYPDGIHPDRKEVSPAEPSGKPPEAI